MLSPQILAKRINVKKFNKRADRDGFAKALKWLAADLQVSPDVALAAYDSVAPPKPSRLVASSIPNDPRSVPNMPTREEYLAATNQMNEFMLSTQDFSHIGTFKVGEKLDESDVKYLEEVNKYHKSVKTVLVYLSYTSDIWEVGLQDYSRRVHNEAENMLEIAEDDELKMSSKVRRLTEMLRSLKSLTVVKE